MHNYIGGGAFNQLSVYIVYTYILKYKIIFPVAMRWLLIVLSNVSLCEGVKFSFLKTAKTHREKKGEIH